MAETDLDRVMEIEEACFPNPWPREAFVVDGIHAEYSRSMVLRDAARPDSGIEGYVCFWIIEGDVEIQNIAVVPGERRRGGGWALMAAALHESKRLGCEAAYLEVRPSNGAGRALYKRWGFAQVGRRRHYYSDGEDALVLRADLACTPNAEILGGQERFLKARKGG